MKSTTNILLALIAGSMLWIAVGDDIRTAYRMSTCQSLQAKLIKNKETVFPIDPERRTEAQRRYVKTCHLRNWETIRQGVVPEDWKS